MEIPIFDGDGDAYGWVHKLERFFQIRGIPEEEKLHDVMVALDGKAFPGFQWWETWNPHTGWGNFKLTILERFQVSNTRNPFAALLALKQKGPILDFVEQFDKFAGMLKGMDETPLDIFVNGQKKDTGAEIKLYKNLVVWNNHPSPPSGSRLSTSYKPPSISRAITIDTTQKSVGKS